MKSINDVLGCRDIFDVSRFVSVEKLIERIISTYKKGQVVNATDVHSAMVGVSSSFTKYKVSDVLIQYVHKGVLNNKLEVVKEIDAEKTNTVGSDVLTIVKGCLKYDGGKMKGVNIINNVTVNKVIALGIAQNKISGDPGELTSKALQHLLDTGSIVRTGTFEFSRVADIVKAGITCSELQDNIYSGGKTKRAVKKKKVKKTKGVEKVAKQTHKVTLIKLLPKDYPDIVMDALYRCEDMSDEYPSVKDIYKDVARTYDVAFQNVESALNTLCAGNKIKRLKPIQAGGLVTYSSNVGYPRVNVTAKNVVDLDVATFEIAKKTDGLTECIGTIETTHKVAMALAEFFVIMKKG